MPQRAVALLPLPSLSAMPAGLSEFAVEGTVVSVVSQEVPQGMPERRVNGCRFNHIQGDPSSWKSFQKAGMAEADSILLGGWRSQGASGLSKLTAFLGVLCCRLMGSARLGVPPLRHGLVSAIQAFSTYLIGWSTR